MGTQLLLPKRGRAPLPILDPCPLWPNGWMDQVDTWHRGGPWFRLHCARLGPSSPPQKGGAASSQFSAHFYCDQTTAGCIKMPLGIEVGLSPVCVRWGPSCPCPERGRSPPPQFSTHVYCGQTSGWIKMALGTEVGLSPGRIVLDWDPAPLPQKRGQSRPNFRPIFIVAKRLDASRCHLVWR